MGYKVINVAFCSERLKEPIGRNASLHLITFEDLCLGFTINVCVRGSKIVLYIGAKFCTLEVCYITC